MGRSGALAWSVRLLYRVAPPAAEESAWTVATVGYECRIRVWNGPSVLTYHWHPVGRSPVTSPHLHLSSRTVPVDLSKAHLPTGSTALPAVVRLADTELGVEPLQSD